MTVALWHWARPADTVVFDPTEVADRATSLRPTQAATSVCHVLVNGCVELHEVEQPALGPGGSC